MDASPVPPAFSVPPAFAAVPALLAACAPQPSGVRVLGIDGRSGAGKTTLARALARDPDVSRVALDAIYPGWDGLAAGIERLVEWVLEPLSTGRPAAYHRWDWDRDEWIDPPQRVRASRFVVIEGVGAGAAACRPYLSALVWLELDDRARYRRAIGRDGATYEPHWERWAAQERRYLSSDDPAAAADLVVPTAGPDPATATAPAAVPDPAAATDPAAAGPIAGDGPTLTSQP